MPAGLTPLSLVLLAAAAVAAVADWTVVARGGRAAADPAVGAVAGVPVTSRVRVGSAAAATTRAVAAPTAAPAAAPTAAPTAAQARLVTKPLVLVLLLGVALSLTPADPAVRAWFVVALACSLVGDVALLSSRGFVVGLAAFLVGHVAYTVGFLVGGLSLPLVAAGVGAMLVLDAVLARRLVPALRASGHGSLVPPVLAYMAAITAMVATAAGAAIPLAALGAALFAASDAILADGRFVRRRRHGGLAVMVLYHVGQACLVLSLVA